MRVRYHPVIKALVLLSAMGAARLAFAQTPATALATALRGTQSSGVLLDAATGSVLASIHPGAAEVTATPGSVTKPLWLAYALDHGIVRPETEVYCRRNLTIGTRHLPCTHPADQAVFTAETALAESCNTWFAELGRRYTGSQLEAAARDLHLKHLNFAEATPQQRELAMLGLQGVTVTPTELARAYTDLLRRLPADSPVRRGMKASVEYGMANPAAVTGRSILGKTGTASNPGEAWTHGWFAGAFEGKYIVVIYVPHGDGGTAARLAHNLFVSLASPNARPR